MKTASLNTALYNGYEPESARKNPKALGSNVDGDSEKERNVVPSVNVIFLSGVKEGMCIAGLLPRPSCITESTVSYNHGLKTIERELLLLQSVKNLGIATTKL